MSNFGVAFHQLLKRIHYPGVNQYEPHNFDWFVYQPGLEPFLNWIVHHISEKNYLSEEELTKYASLTNEVIENNEERQKLLDILISLENGKMIVPWTNYQRNLSEQYSCIKSQTQALKSQLNWKQQQYKTLLMKGPKTKEKIRETRRQLEQLLQLTSTENLLSLIQSSPNSNQCQQLGINYLQLERNYLSLLLNIWSDDYPTEQNPNIELIKQLNHRTVKLVRLEVDSALANVQFDTLKSQIQLCSQLKKYFESTSIEDLKKLSDRLGTKLITHQQQRIQYENQLFNIYSSRHEHQLETIYLNILEQQFNTHQDLYRKQQIILQGLQQQRNFSQIVSNLIEHRLTLIDQMKEQMNKILQYNQMIIDCAKSTNQTINTNKDLFSVDTNVNNLLERVKSIENQFSKNSSIVNQFLEYTQQQNDDFRPKANDLSNQLMNDLQRKISEWKHFCETTTN